MNSPFSIPCVVKRLLLLGGFALSTGIALASPGAHGPNGEHLDAAPKAGATSSTPRLEAKSENYEIVGRLQGGELSMFINRFASNEPVDQAKVEVELGPLKAPAPYHSDQGDYAVADEKFLSELGKKGSHALVITILDGQDSDLLDGTLEVGATQATAEAAHAHGEDNALLFGALAIAALAAVGGLGWLVGRGSNRKLAKGGAQ
ncbi:hypothetical protein [Comamonas thiooxydans]|uniref:hypothetical protein n=1 Tax=Comamonas thiooxydans TaxID=363952 RepID=UPI002115B0E9|nr:hypothetical protein [Comamonas thiooxydans]UUE95118.1 hypothetical protein MJ608_05585 [Comamonas thiooxydans]